MKTLYIVGYLTLKSPNIIGSVRSQTPALAVIHKSVRVEIFRGIRVMPSLLEKEVSRKVRKGAKKSDFLCAFASLRETCSLELSNIHVF